MILDGPTALRSAIEKILLLISRCISGDASWRLRNLYYPVTSIVSISILSNYLNFRSEHGI